MAEMLYHHRSFFSCKDNTLNVCVNDNNNNDGPVAMHGD